MITINSSEIKQFESDLLTFKKRAYPFATKATVNKAAFVGRTIAQSIVRGKMTQRNKFTQQSIRVQQTRTLIVSRQEALLGSVADYMADQEFGTVLFSNGRAGRPIATPYASGEQSLPRRRLPRKANKMANIRLPRGKRPGANRKAKNRAAILMAAQGNGRRYVFLDMGRRSGIYKVLGGKRKPRIRKVWDMSRRSVRIPARPWLLPATTKASKEMPHYYRDALVFQLKRHGIFR